MQTSYEKTKPAKRENIKRVYTQSKAPKQLRNRAKIRDAKRNYWSQLCK